MSPPLNYIYHGQLFAICPWFFLIDINAGLLLFVNFIYCLLILRIFVCEENSKVECPFLGQLNEFRFKHRGIKVKRGGHVEEVFY